MRRWQHRYWYNLRTDNIIVLLLLVAAALLVTPALRKLSPSPALREKQALRQRMLTIAARARTERCVYTITLYPHTGRMAVARWVMAGKTARPVPVAELSTALARGVVVQRTSLHERKITINAGGFVLSNGEIVLRAPDGSRAVLPVGDDSDGE